MLRGGRGGRGEAALAVALGRLAGGGAVAHGGGGEGEGLAQH
jgi:hypothetical protein